jgi:hypothetical protein
MPLVSTLGGQGGAERHVMQPLCVNVLGSPRATPAEADKIVALLVRCHSQRRRLKAGGADSTPRSRALSAESKALAAPELEQLRSFKEGASPAEWSRLKKRVGPGFVCARPAAAHSAHDQPSAHRQRRSPWQRGSTIVSCHRSASPPHPAQAAAAAAAAPPAGSSRRRRSSRSLAPN